MPGVKAAGQAACLPYYGFKPWQEPIAAHRSLWVFGIRNARPEARRVVHGPDGKLQGLQQGRRGFDKVFIVLACAGAGTDNGLAVRRADDDKARVALVVKIRPFHPRGWCVL